MHFTTVRPSDSKKQFNSVLKKYCFRDDVESEQLCEFTSVPLTISHQTLKKILEHDDNSGFIQL